MALSLSQRELLSQFDFTLCSSASELRQSFDLRLAVFHDEQGFPADTEVDEYDPISAHFLVTARQDGMPVATVRVTPYPRKPWLVSAASVAAAEENNVTQNETSVVTSGGGPGGTSGGLPMFTSKDDMHSGGDRPATKTKGTPAEASDDDRARQEYPLGRPLRQAELASRFVKTIQSSGPIEEEHGAPAMRGAKVSRLAVSRSERGKHLGALVMQQVEGWLLSLGKKIDKETASTDSGTNRAKSFDIVISSQMHAKPFYEKLGYAVYGEPYDEEGAPHCWCVKTVNIPPSIG